MFISRVIGEQSDVHGLKLIHNRKIPTIRYSDKTKAKTFLYIIEKRVIDKK